MKKSRAESIKVRSDAVDEGAEHVGQALQQLKAPVAFAHDNETVG